MMLGGVGAVAHTCSLKAAQRGVRGPQAMRVPVKPLSGGCGGPQAPEKYLFSRFAGNKA